MIIVYLSLKEIAKIFSKYGCIVFPLLPVIFDSSSFSATSPILDIFSLFYFGWSSDYVVIFHCGYNSFLPNTKDIEHLSCVYLLN